MMPEHHYIKPVIILGSDEDGTYCSPFFNECNLEELRRKIYVCVKLLQLVTSRLLENEGFDNRTFTIDPETETEGISVFRSTYNKNYLQSISSERLWESLAKEIYNQYISPARHKVKVIGFLTCTEYSEVLDDEPVPSTYSEVLKRTRGYVMCGIGGFALIGIGCLYTWASSFDQVSTCLRSSREVEPRKFQMDSSMRGTWGACYSTALGSVLHELFHLFDLIHASEGIMGTGFTDIDHFILKHLPSWLPELFGNSLFKEPMQDYGYGFDCSSSAEAIESSHQNSELNCDIASDCRITCGKKFFLDRPSLVTLAFHRFLKSAPRTAAEIRRFGTSLNSAAGLRLVALRNGDKTVKHWEFLGDVPRKVFTIPTILDSTSLHVFAVDDAGNVAKFEWS